MNVIFDYILFAFRYRFLFPVRLGVGPRTSRPPCSPLSLFCSPLPGVGVAVGFFEVLARHVGVDLGGAEVGVAQQFFDGVDVGAFVEQMCGEAVAEDVWADAVGLRHGCHVLLDGFADIVLGEG